MIQSGGAFALVSFSLGVLIGYLWRDYISRARYRFDRKQRDRLRENAVD